MRGYGEFIVSFVAALLVLSSGSAATERLNFSSAARNSTVAQIFQGNTAYTDRIHGDLQLPSSGSGPFPAMVIMHSSRGIVATIQAWARMFNDIGVATFVVDSFTPRGLTEQSAGQLSFPAGAVDALSALKTLTQDPRIDHKRIGVIGFSRGAVAAMTSGFERFRAGVLGVDGGVFALHVAFYGGCTQYARTTGVPVLTLIGSDDDFEHPDLCRKVTEILRQQGASAELVVYQGALHGFDTDFPRQSMPMVQNLRNCRMLQNMDTFEAVLLDGRTLTPAERTSYASRCAGNGAVRGGDARHAAAARERVKLFVGEHLGLPR
jgi:dienelactone hydrolase